MQPSHGIGQTRLPWASFFKAWFRTPGSWSNEKIYYHWNMYFQHIIFEARFRKYSQPHKEKFLAESSLNFGIYLIFISYKFVFHFTWSYLSISVSSNTWINDMIKLNNQPCAYISTTTLHSLTSQEVNFEWGRGKIIKSLLLNLWSKLNMKTKVLDTSKKFFILIGLL